MHDIGLALWCKNFICGWTHQIFNAEACFQPASLTFMHHIKSIIQQNIHFSIQQHSPPIGQSVCFLAFQGIIMISVLSAVLHGSRVTVISAAGWLFFFSVPVKPHNDQVPGHILSCVSYQAADQSASLCRKKQHPFHLPWIYITQISH